MKIQHLHHSGFAVYSKSATLVFDYFDVPECPPLPQEVFSEDVPLYVFVSHAHHDHYSPSVLRWKEQKQNIVYLFSSDAAKRSKDSTVHSLSAGGSFADGVLNVRAFGSTDVGVSFAVELDGMRLFHAGDLNNWHWEGESTTEEISDMATRFHRILSDIAGVYPSFDVAFFPVDPRMQGDYALGAREFLQKISCVNFIPMHFWGILTLRSLLRQPLRHWAPAFCVPVVAVTFLQFDYKRRFPS